MVVVTSTTTKVHLNGTGDNGHGARPSSLFGHRGSSGSALAPALAHTPIGGSPEGVMDSASRVGLDYIVENPDYIHKLASALGSKNSAVKKQVFELLSALSVYSSEGYGRTLQALDAFRAQIGERYRFKFLVAELAAETSNLDYKTSILAFINCLILASPDSAERIRTRAEFIGLKLVHVLNELRARHKDTVNAGLIIQLDVFDEQKESDESQSQTSSIDLSCPVEVFDAILRVITGTPQEVPFLAILQHLLSIDSKEPVSDLIWDAAERLVHRATLLESRDDAMKLLKAAPSHSKSQSQSLQKLKGVGVSSVGASDGKCSACGCHGGSPSTVPSPPAPAPPPPAPAPPGTAQPITATTPPAPAPPPPAPSPPAPALPKAHASSPTKPLPRLPQQSLPPVPRAKMKTINWNKIPNGQILGGAGHNLWTTFSKKQATSSLLDWQELDGLFCLQNEGGAGGVHKFGGGGSHMNGDAAIPRVNVKEIAGRNGTTTTSAPTPPPQPSFGAGAPKKETSELILLDAKRSLNINIFLKQFRSSNAEIVNLILKGGSAEIGAEKLRGLLKLLPSSDEVEMLSAVSEVDQLRLGSAEKFLLALVQQVNHYRLRVEAMLLREELELSLVNIDSSISAILTAAADVKASEQFQQIIFMILVAGNFLNSGGYAGDAAGVKLSSLQKIGDIRGNKPGISLLHFIVMQAEAKDPKLVSFVNEMPALEEASKTSIEQLRAEITSLKSKVGNLSAQMGLGGAAAASGPKERPKVPHDILQQYGTFLEEASSKIFSIESYFGQVEATRLDLAQFFCEEAPIFKIEDCFKIILGFVNKWRDASSDNAKRRKQEAEAEARRRVREEQFKKRAAQLSNEELRGAPGERNGRFGVGVGMTQLSPDDDLFIACSPRIVRRRLGSLASHDNMSSGSTQGSNDQLTLPSPDITPNGSIRKRRSRLGSSDEDESSLMDFLRSSGSSGGPTAAGAGVMNPHTHFGSPSTPRKLPGSIIDNQYGSLDRSWSRGTRRRPNLMEFVNSDRERPISPATHAHAHAAAAASAAGKTDGHGGAGGDTTGPSGGDHKHESPAREWRDRITAWFVDLEHGGGSGPGGDGGRPAARPPPRRFQSRFADETTRGLATLPEVEPNNPDEGGASTTASTNYSHAYRTPFTTRGYASRGAPTEDGAPGMTNATTTPSTSTSSSTYERVYPDRRPSLKVNTDVVSAMEAIEGAQTPTKEKTLWQTSSINSDTPKVGGSKNASSSSVGGRRSLIGSLGTTDAGRRGSQDDDKLTLYIPEGGRHTPRSGGASAGAGATRSPEVHESEFGTKEGFDRFASIRRSRRLKKSDSVESGGGGATSRPTSFGKAPPGPDTPAPSRRFISKVDITEDDHRGAPANSPPSSSSLFARTTKAGTLQRTGAGGAPTPTNIRGRSTHPRSTSMIDSKQVESALNLHKYSTPRSGATRDNSNAIPIPGGGGKVANANVGGSSLSSSPAGTSTSAENDEGFEESPNSLTDTNNATGDLVHQNNLTNRAHHLRRSFRDKEDAHTQASKGAANGSAKANLFSIPSLMRRKSMKENGTTDPATTTHTLSTTPRRPFNSNSNGAANGGFGAGAGHRSTTTPTTYAKTGSANGQTNGHANGVCKGVTAAPRTPRILSFMRPTASSSAKDKLEAAAAKAATVAANKSGGLYSNKRAFK